MNQFLRSFLKNHTFFSLQYLQGNLTITSDPEICEHNIIIVIIKKEYLYLCSEKYRIILIDIDRNIPSYYRIIGISYVSDERS